MYNQIIKTGKSGKLRSDLLFLTALNNFELLGAGLHCSLSTVSSDPHHSHSVRKYQRHNKSRASAVTWLSRISAVVTFVSIPSSFFNKQLFYKQQGFKKLQIKQLKASKMAKIKQFEACTKIFVAYKKNWVY